MRVLIFSHLFIFTLLARAPSPRGKRVIFGVPLARGDLPYLTSLVSQFPHHGKKGGTLCGGSLIAPNIVLTAAHCVFDEKYRTNAITIRVTVNDFALGQPDKAEKSFITNLYDIHPLYLKSGFDSGFDVALVYLKEKIEICKNWDSIKIARLPADPVSGKKSFSDDQLKSAPCFHSGWGITNAGSNARVAQRMRVMNIAFNENHYLGGRSFIVKGAASSRPCFGDSGGPVYCDIDGLRYVVGIASQITSPLEPKKASSNSTVQECSQSSQLESCDLRTQMDEIMKMIENRGLDAGLISSYKDCFSNNKKKD